MRYVLRIAIGVGVATSNPIVCKSNFTQVRRIITLTALYNNKHKCTPLIFTSQATL